jgi:transcriptional regulator with XRE-family HTH domain
MSTSTQTRRRELGDFLRRRRESLSPEAAGIIVYGRRRTPGLRRDEVAGRANMSPVYLERLEQGRGPTPSVTMLAGLARALELSDQERDHLYRLVGHAPAPASEPAGFVDPELLAAMGTLAPAVPAEIMDELGTVLVQNKMSVALFGALAGLEPPASNLIWRWFTEPDWRRRTEPADQHEQTSVSYAAALRTALSRRADDRQARELVGLLLAASGEFAELWARHPVDLKHCPRMEITVEPVGWLHLDCTLMLSMESTQRLLLLGPVDPESAARLARLHEIHGV